MGPLAIIFGLGILGIVFALWLAQNVLARDRGTPEMQQVSNAIYEGAMAFMRRQYGTIVAAQPPHRVFPAHAFGEPHRDLPEKLVARRMPEGVVHVLEAVDVDEEHRERPAVALRVRDVLREAIVEERPVRKSGEVVVQRLIGLVVLFCIDRGDAPDDRHRADDPGSPLHGRR